jgi:hypothetical protein
MREKRIEGVLNLPRLRGSDTNPAPGRFPFPCDLTRRADTRQCGPGEPGPAAPAAEGEVLCRCRPQERAGRSCPYRAPAPAAAGTGSAPPMAQRGRQRVAAALAPGLAQPRGAPPEMPPGQAPGRPASRRGPPRRAGRSSAGRSGGWARSGSGCGTADSTREPDRRAVGRSSRRRRGRPRPPAAPARSPTPLSDKGSSSLLLGGSCLTGSAARLTSRRGLLLKSTQAVRPCAPDGPRFSAPFPAPATRGSGRARRGAWGKRAGARQRP